jgi:peptidoglycan/LPS O-acetylase OafA/YrhL
MAWWMSGATGGTNSHEHREIRHLVRIHQFSTILRPIGGVPRSRPQKAMWHVKKETLVVKTDTKSISQRPRLEWLDYLRGILAVSVMVCHFTAWHSIPWPPVVDKLIEKAGTFAVSGFYVISGYSIAYIYFQQGLSRSFLISFAIKRFLRLAPLLWLTIALAFLMGYAFTIEKLLLNVTLLFGFVAHDRYIATGSWSIGNEIVFYALFPALMFFAPQIKARIWCSAVLLAAFVFAWWAALFWIPNATSTEMMWSRYIHPANQFWLFAVG